MGGQGERIDKLIESGQARRSRERWAGWRDAQKRKQRKAAVDLVLPAGTKQVSDRCMSMGTERKLQPWAGTPEGQG